jgi:branched-chain amino acid transport system substrate-binding protein
MKKQTMKTLVIVIAVLSIFLPANLLAASNDTFRLGVLLPLSGGGAPWGIATLRSFELMADKINTEGGVRVGGKSYQIELVKADTKTNFDNALAQANRLIFDQKIKYIMGPIISGCVLAILPVTEKNKVMVMSLAYSPKVLGADKKYSFRLYAAGNERIPALFDYLKKNHPEVKTIGLIGPNDETGWGNSKFAKKSAEEFGFKVTFEDFVQRGTTDYFPILTKLMTKNPDALIIHSIPPGSTALLIQQKFQLGYKGLVLSPSHFDYKMLKAKAGAEAVEGFIYQTPDISSIDTPPGMLELVKNYEKKYKEDFDPVSIAGYCMIWVLKMAIEKANTFDTTAVAKAMENLEGDYPYGKFSMGGLKSYGAKHQIVEPIFFSQIKDGKVKGLGSVIGNAP